MRLKLAPCLIRLCPALLALSVAPACVESTPIGGNPVDTEGDETDSDVSDTEFPTAECVDSPPEFACTVPFSECNAECGGPASVFDSNGCLRQTCQDTSECPAGRECVRTGDWGGGPPSSTFCEMFDGECSCGSTADGNPDVRVCVPSEDIPVVDPVVCDNYGSGNGFEWTAGTPVAGLSTCTVMGVPAPEIQLDCTGAMTGTASLSIAGLMTLDLQGGEVLTIEYIVEDNGSWQNEWLDVTNDANALQSARAAQTSELLPSGAAADFWGVNFALEAVPSECPFVACDGGSTFDLGTRPAAIRAGGPDFFEDFRPGQSGDIPGKFGGISPRLFLRQAVEGGCPSPDAGAPPQWYALSVVSAPF